MPIDINKLYGESSTTSSHSSGDINDDLTFLIDRKRENKSSDKKNHTESQSKSNSKNTNTVLTEPQPKKLDKEIIPPFFLQDPKLYGNKPYVTQRPKITEEDVDRINRHVREKAFTHIRLSLLNRHLASISRMSDKMYPEDGYFKNPDIPEVFTGDGRRAAERLEMKARLNVESPIYKLTNGNIGIGLKPHDYSDIKDLILEYDDQNGATPQIKLPDPKPISQQSYFNDFDANAQTTSPFLLNPSNRKQAIINTDDGQTVKVETYRSYNKPLTANATTAYDFDSKFKKGQINTSVANNTVYEKLSKILFYKNKLRLGEKLSGEEELDYERSKNSIGVALMVSNPTYFRLRIENLAEQNKAIEEAREKEEEDWMKEHPNYFGNINYILGKKSALPSIYKPVELTARLGSLLRSEWAKSAFSDYIIDANMTQAESGLGKYARALEFEQMVEDSKKYVRTVEDQERAKDAYSNLLKLGHRRTNLQELQLRLYYIKIHNYDKELLKLKPSFDKINSRSLYWWENLIARGKNLVGSMGRLVFGDSFYGDYTDSEKYELLLSSLSDDELRKAAVEKIRLEKERAASGYSRNSYAKYRPVRTKADDFIDDMNNAVDKIKPLKELWYNGYQSDLKDIEDWKTGNDIFGFNARVDAFYAKQKQIVQEQSSPERHRSVVDDGDSTLVNMNPFDSRTLMYGMSGLWGASNSSWYKSAASTASKIVGVVAGMFSGGMSTTILLGAAAVSFGADTAQSMDENNAEVTQGILTRFGRLLDSNGLSKLFYEKGERELSKIKDELYLILKDLLKYKNLINKRDSGLASLNSEELRFIKQMEKKYGGKVPEYNEYEMYDYITKQFIAQRWNAKNSKIDRIFANSLLGADELYKNDYYATARDAAIDAFLFCIPTGKIMKAIPKTWSTALNEVYSGYTNAKEALVAQVFANSLKTQAVAVPLIKLAGATTTGIMSEQLEEVTQSMNSRAFVSGQYDYSINKGVSRRIYDDVINNLPIVWDFWLGGRLNGLSNDSELISSMNGATLLALPNILGLSGFSHIKAATDRCSIAEQIQAVQYAKKQGDRIQMIQDMDYVKMADKQQHANDMFDAYIAGMKNKMTSSRTGMILNQNGQTVANHETESGHITIDDIEEQRKRFDKIANLAKSRELRSIALEHGIINEEEAQLGLKQSIKNKLSNAKTYLDNEDYQIFVALQSYLDDEYDAAKEQFTEVDKKNKTRRILKKANFGEATDTHKNKATINQQEQQDLYDKMVAGKEKAVPTKPTSKKKSKQKAYLKAFDEYQDALKQYNELIERKKQDAAEKLKDRDSQIAQLAALMLIKRDYSSTFGKLTYKGYLLRNIDDIIQATARKLGLSQEQVDELANSEEKLIDQYASDQTFVRENMSRGRYNALTAMGLTMMNDVIRLFNENPMSFIKLLKKAQEEDDRIEYGVIRALDERDKIREDAAKRPLVEGDEYEDSEGNRYKIIKKDDGSYVSHVIDKDGNPYSDVIEITDAAGNKVTEKTPREFPIDREAYHLYKLKQEEQQRKEEGRELAEQQRANDEIDSKINDDSTEDKSQSTEDKSDENELSGNETKRTFGQKIREAWRRFRDKLKRKKKKLDEEYAESSEDIEEGVLATEESEDNVEENEEEQVVTDDTPVLTDTEEKPEPEPEEKPEPESLDDEAYDKLDDVPMDGEPHLLSFNGRFINPVPMKGVVYAFFSKPWANPWKQSENEKKAAQLTEKYVRDLTDQRKRDRIQKKLPKDFKIVHDTSNNTWSIEYTGPKDRANYRHNETLRIYIEGNEDAGYFELVCDYDPKTGKPNGEYSVHFKPSEGRREMFSDEERKLLFDALAANIPEGGVVTSHGQLTKGGLHGLNRFFEDYGFVPVTKNGKPSTTKGYLIENDSDGNEKLTNLNIPKYQKPKTKPKVVAPSGSTVTLTKEQEEVIGKLLEKLERDDKAVRWNKDPNDKDAKGSVLRTALNYFIKVGAMIVQHNRLHAILESYKRISNDRLGKINQIQEELQQILNDIEPMPKGTTVAEHYKKYIDAVMKLREQRLKELADMFGEGSLAYLFHSQGLDFTGYFKNQTIIKESPEKIAEILTRDIPNRSVIAGTIIDEICRELFAGNAVENKPQYRMDDKTFNDLITRLEAIKKDFEDRGWVLDTTPYVWHTKLPNGKYVAGETDMIAITPEGKIVVLDFKTTKLNIKPKIGYRVKKIKEDETDPDEYDYEFVDDESEIPEEYRTENTGHPYVYRSDYEVSTFSDAGVTLIQQYAELLTAYSMMIEQELGTGVEDMLLIVMLLEHSGIEKDGKLSKLELDKIDNVVDARVISLTKDDIPGVAESIANIQKELTKKNLVITLEEAIDIKKQLTALKEDLIKRRAKLDKNNPLYSKVTSVIAQLTLYLNELEPYTKNSKKSESFRENADAVNSLMEKSQKLSEKYQELVDNIVAAIESEKKGLKPGRKGILSKVFGNMLGDGKPAKHTEEKGINEDRRKQTNEYIPDDDAQPEDVTEEDQQHWYLFNTLAGLAGHLKPGKFTDAVKALFGFDGKRNPVTLDPDFITNSEIILSVTEDPKKNGAYTVRARIYHHGNATRKGRWYDYKTKDGKTIGFLVNMGFNEDGSPSKMSKNLKIKLRYLLEQLMILQQQGIDTDIVVTEATRSNGAFVKSSMPVSLMNLNDFLGKNNEKIHDLIKGDESLIGIAKEGPDGRVSIYSLSEDSNDMSISYETMLQEDDANSELIKDGEKQIYSDDQEESSDTLIPGTIFFLHKVVFNEDEDGVVRTIPIPLIPAKLMNEEIDEILSILSEGKNHLQDEAIVTVRYKDGTSDRMSIGMTNLLILNMLVRFGGLSFQQDNRFVFTFLNDLNDEQLKEIGINSRVGLTNKLLITDMSKSTGEYRVVNISKPEDMSWLKQNLKLCYMYTNRYSALRHNLNGERDSYSGNPYLKIFNFVKSQKKDIQSIVLSTRENVTDDYKLSIDIDDMSIGNKDAALSGAGWMIKRGIIQTQVLGLENPFVSIFDAELMDSKTGDILTSNSPKDSEENEPQDGPIGQVTNNPPEDPTGSEGKGTGLIITGNIGDFEDTGSNSKQEEGEEKTPSAKPSTPEKDSLEDRKGTTDAPESSSSGRKISDEDAARIAAAKLANKRHARGRGVHRIVTSRELRKLANKDRIIKRIKRVFGKKFSNIEWFTGIIEHAVGGDVIGRMTSDAIQLSETDYLEGVEYHEMFHRIWNIILPVSVRERIETHIRKKYGISDRTTIDETLAELYRVVHNNVNEKANAHSNILTRTFVTFKEYVSQLSLIKDWQVAAMFLSTDIGIARIFGPNEESIRAFEMYAGTRNMTIFDKEGNRVSFETVSDFAGQKIFDEVLNALFREITADLKYNIGTIGLNAERLNDATKLSSIKMLHSDRIYAEQSKAEGMSPWFKVVSGQYIKDGVSLTDLDMNIFMEIMPDDLRELYIDQFYDKFGDDVVDAMDDAEFNEKFRSFVKDSENEKTEPNQLIGAQRIMNEMFSKWNVVQYHLEQKINKQGLRNKVEKEEEQEETFSIIGESMAYIMSNSYDHSRIEEMTDQVRFMLSTIPDERYATQEDVESGRVKGLYNADGTRVTIANRTPNARLRRYLPLKEVSTKLLVACHECETLLEMIDTMRELGKQDPMFDRIGRHLALYAESQYVKRKDGSYVVYVYDKKSKTGRVLSTNEYTEEKDKDGNTVYKDKDGNVIENAEILVNHSIESLVTQVFLYLRCAQKQFDMVYIQSKRDENGNKADSGVNISIRSTSSTWAASLLPKKWFRHFRSGATLFYTDAKGKIKFMYGGKQQLKKAINNIVAINESLSKAKPTAIVLSGYGRSQLNPFDDADLQTITRALVDSLNTIGIDVNVDEFVYFCQYIANTPGKYDGTVLSKIFKRHDKVFTAGTFIQDLINISHNLDKSDFEKVFGQERKAGMAGKKRLSAVGEYLFTDSSFVKALAEAKVLQNRLTKDLSTDGPGNTKRYTMTQLNEIEQNCEDINKGWITYDKVNKKLVAHGSRILAQMIQYAGVCFVDGVFNGVPHVVGSLLAKQLLRTEESETRPEGLGTIQIIDDGGVRTEDSKQGGVSYQDQTEREACISKMSLLQKGYVLFGTLSDKASNFFIKGIRTLGFDYDRKDGITTSMLPIICDDAWVYNFKDPSGTSTQAIDLLIEYAQCEYEAIKRNYKRLNSGKLSVAQKVKNFFAGTQNSVHFGVMNVVYEFNDDGTFKAEHRLDDPVDVEGNIKIAEKYFFGENVTQEQRRRSVAYAVLQLTKDQLNLMEEYGIITKDAKGRYVNIGIDSGAIDRLVETYKDKISKMKSTTKKKYSVTAANKYYEHCAICAYAADIQMKSIQSEEETERYFTGLPQFFKWVYKNGKLSDRYSDQSKRHGGAGSTGNVNRKDLKGIPKTYKCAEFKDEEMVSEFGTVLHEAFVHDELEHALFNKFVNEGMDKKEAADKIFNTHSYSEEEMRELLGEDISNFVDEKAKQRIDPYINKNFYAADGAAYITPKMTENLLRMRGVFTDDVAAAFALLDGSLKFRIKNLFFGFTQGSDKSKYEMSQAQAYKIIQEALIGSLKYSAYGIRMMGRVSEEDEDEVPIHYYNKFALFPVFPQIATGKWSTILEKMEEQGVQMLLSDLAVKVGEAGAVKLGDLLDLQDLKFNTYDQDYVHIRRQMNTDPHEAKDRPIGTQTLKVALLAIKPYLQYTVSDGRGGTKIVSGLQLVQDIMDSINELCDIGIDKFNSKFFDAAGEFDVEKFSQFLYKQLSDREANANLLDAILIENGKMKLDLETTSSSGWIESIIASILGKEAIDVNTPGSAYYQRSVYGHEGGSIVGLTMYNGKSLMTLNEKGCMDAVCSIDYFNHIFEEGYKQGTIDRKTTSTFAQRKLWLLDHNIIGENAEPSSIGYRIPTQAQSSIHGLRFVDVLDVVRDTIILPKDFVSVTGSDFDIDKLYLFAPNFNGKTLDYNFNREDDTVKFLQNKLVFSYFAALNSGGSVQQRKNEDGSVTDVYIPGHSFADSYGAIDKDTELSKSVLEDIEGSSSKVWRPFEHGSLAYQLSQRAAFLGGKEGIGPFALHNNSQVLTQLFGVRFSEYLSNGEPTFLKILHATDLSNDISRRGYEIVNGEKRTLYGNTKILSWLSGLINAHVDVAKDPWIIRLNVKKYTWNTLNLLVRTGFDKNAYALIDQPIINEMANIAASNQGEFLNDPTKSANKNTKDDCAYLVEQLFGKSKTGVIRYDLLQEDLSADGQQRIGYIMKDLFGIDEDGDFNNTFTVMENGVNVEKSGSILFDILKNPNAYENPNGLRTVYNLKNDSDLLYYIPSLDMYLTPLQVLYYVYIGYNHFENYAQGLSDLVNCSKIDTKKQGKTYAEEKAYLAKYNAFIEQNTDPNAANPIFERDGILRMFNDDLCYIEHKTKAVIGTYMRLLSNFSLQATPAFNIIYDQIASELGIYPSDLKATKKVVNSIYAMIKSKFFYGENGWISLHIKKSPRSLLIGDSSVAAKLSIVQQSLKSGRRYLVNDDGQIIQDENGEAMYEYDYDRYSSSGIISNPLLKVLSEDVYQQNFKGESQYRFIYCDGTMLDDTENDNDLIAAWDEMLSDNKTTFYVKTKDENGEYVMKPFTMKEFAEELIAYAFITSADKPGQTAFFKYVPNTWRASSGYDECIRNIRSLFENGDFSMFGSIDDIVDEILLNNWTDTTFVKNYDLLKFKFDPEAQRKVGYMNGFIFNLPEKLITYKDRWKYNGREKEADRKLPPAFAACKQNGRPTVYDRNGSYPKYLSVKRPFSQANDHKSRILYKLVDTIEIENVSSKAGKQATFVVPIYALVAPKGIRVRAQGYSYNITQYFDDSYYQLAYTTNSQYLNETSWMNGGISKLREQVRLLANDDDSLDKDDNFKEEVIDNIVMSDDTSDELIGMSQQELGEDKDYQKVYYRNLLIAAQSLEREGFLMPGDVKAIKKSLDLHFGTSTGVKKEKQQTIKLTNVDHSDYEISVLELGQNSFVKESTGSRNIAFRSIGQHSLTNKKFKEIAEQALSATIKKISKASGKQRSNITDTEKKLLPLFAQLFYEKNQVYIIGNIGNDGEVRGHGRYVFEMTLLLNKNDRKTDATSGNRLVIVYDCATNEWVRFDAKENEWVTLKERPVLAPTAAIYVEQMDGDAKNKAKDVVDNLLDQVIENDKKEEQQKEGEEFDPSAKNECN